ncbi:unnamed protein product [Effrenium voratum]|nr:unnamed protein product [Effrenium voratum]
MALHMLCLLAVTAVLADGTEARSKTLLLCKAAVWRKWSSGLEEVSVLVNSTMEADSSSQLSYEQAARLLAERQLAACTREATAADLEAHGQGGLSDAAVERLLADALQGPGLEDKASLPSREIW